MDLELELEISQQPLGAQATLGYKVCGEDSAAGPCSAEEEPRQRAVFKVLLCMQMALSEVGSEQGKGKLAESGGGEHRLKSCGLFPGLGPEG